MPPDVSVAPSMPVVSSLPQPAPQTTSAGNGAAQVVSAAFGSELAKALAVPPQPKQPAATTDAAAAPPAEVGAQPATPTAPETAAASQQPTTETPTASASPATPQATPVASSPQLPVGSGPLPIQLPAASAPSTAEAAPVASHDAATGKKSGTRAAPRQAPTDQQPVTPTIAASPPVTAAVADGAPDTAKAVVSQADATTPAASSSVKPATGAAKHVADADADDSLPRSPLPTQGATPTKPAPPANPSTAEPATAVLPTPTEPIQQAATAPATTPAASATAPIRADSPAAQLAPALMQIGHASDGAQRLTVRLDPPELGHVQVRIDRPSEAPARVEITVEKSETLMLLLRDQPQLQRALDQAGVPSEGRSVTFHVAPSDPAPHSEPSTASAPGVAAGGPSGDGSHGAARNGGQPAHRQASSPDDADADFMPVASPHWVRAGLDITA